MTAPRMDRSIGELFADLSHQVGDLIQQEARLAKAELGAKLSNVGRHAAMVAVAVAFGLTAVIGAATTAVLLLIEADVAPWLAVLITTAMMGFMAFALAQSGLAALRKTSVTPVETIHSLKETTQWLSKSVR